MAVSLVKSARGKSAVLSLKFGGWTETFAKGLVQATLKEGFEPKSRGQE